MLFRSDRKSTRLNSSHTIISYAVFCLKKRKKVEASPPRNAGAWRTVIGQGRSVPALRYRLLLPAPLHPAFPSPRPSFFFFNDTATTEIYTLSLHDALPI